MSSRIVQTSKWQTRTFVLLRFLLTKVKEFLVRNLKSFMIQRGPYEVFLQEQQFQLGPLLRKLRGEARVKRMPTCPSQLWRTHCASGAKLFTTLLRMRKEGPRAQCITRGPLIATQKHVLLDQPTRSPSRLSLKEIVSRRIGCVIPHCNLQHRINFFDISVKGLAIFCLWIATIYHTSSLH